MKKEENTISLSGLRDSNQLERASAELLLGTGATSGSKQLADVLPAGDSAADTRISGGAEERGSRNSESRNKIGLRNGDGDSTTGETEAPDIEKEEEEEAGEQCDRLTDFGPSLAKAKVDDAASRCRHAAVKMSTEGGDDAGRKQRSLADMQMASFKASGESEDCSLCHYLATIRLVANGEPTDQSASSRREMDSAATAICCHDQKSLGKCNQSTSDHKQAADAAEDHQSASGQSIWGSLLSIEVDHNNRNKQQQREVCYEFSEDLVIGRKVIMREEEDDVGQEIINSSESSQSSSSDQPRASANRPSSSHSRLCPQKSDTNNNNGNKTPLEIGQVARCTTRSPIVKRGLSLDANRKQINKNQTNKQQNSTNISKTNSRQSIASRKSQSGGKLIVISCSSVSYMIQVAKEEAPSSIHRISNSISTSNNNCNNNPTKTIKPHINVNDDAINNDVNASNNSESIEAAGRTRLEEGKDKRVATKLLVTEEEERDEEQEQQDSRKKFLVKKISCGSSRRTNSKLKRRTESRIHYSNQQHKVGNNQTANKLLSVITMGEEKTNEQATSVIEVDQMVDAPELNSSVIIDEDENDNQAATQSPPSGADYQSDDLTSVRSRDSDLISNGKTATTKLRRQQKPNVRMNLHAISGGGGTGGSRSQAGDEDDDFNPDETSKSCNIAAKRLRELVAHLEHGSVPQSVLYQTLEYAATILDSVSMDQISRVSDEDEGDLSEVQSDAVPNEVRKWLETTFTRNSISQKRKSEDKLKFRSVANAIRAGIVVDRIYRRMSASTPFVSAEVSQLLRSIDDWSFDCFHINQASNGQVLKSVGYELFNRHGLMYKFKIPTSVLKNFLTQVEMGYVKHKNPYHNNLHAADVTQTVHYLLWQAGLTNWLSDLEIFATLLAAIIHDYLHTGTTNNFHVMSQSDTALVYNDRAVLENFHISQAFTLMRNEDCNILAGLSKDEYREFRSLVIDMVLATDMSSHFQQIKAMKNILNHSDNFNADKSKILSLVIHISDISHPAKDWELHSTWTQLLMEEFFRQGDREKELDLECSPLCDRETTLVAESQLGFIEFIVSPSLEVCGDVLDRVLYQMAEANARPLLPASAKAVSSATVAAIEAPQQQQHQPSSPPPAPAADRKQQAAEGKPQQPAASAGLSGSFASSSETLTSNLRKMIVSSSATIGRKLNISGSSSAAVASSNASTASASSSTCSSSSASSLVRSQQAPPVNRMQQQQADFEQRQASYKHPVIQCDPNQMQRPKSSDPRVSRQQKLGDTSRSDEREDNAQSGAGQTGNRETTVSHEAGKQLQRQPSGSSSQLISNKLQQPAGNELVGGATVKRATNSALATCGQTSRHIQPTKISRPWIKCLERNKRMWQERAVADAAARELKEKLKQQQIADSSNDNQPEGTGL